MNGNTPVTLVGNLTDEPELSYTPSGAAVVKFSVAVNRRTFNKQSNQWEDAGTDFHRVSAWNKLGEHCAATLAKGMKVIVTGDLRQRHWTTDDGQARSMWQVTADDAGPALSRATAVVTKVTTTPATAPASAGYSEEPPF